MKTNASQKFIIMVENGLSNKNEDVSKYYSKING